MTDEMNGDVAEAIQDALSILGLPHACEPNLDCLRALECEMDAARDALLRTGLLPVGLENWPVEAQEKWRALQKRALCKHPNRVDEGDGYWACPDCDLEWWMKRDISA